MEEFGDWIYILIIAVVGVTSLIGSMRKKARQMAEVNNPREITTNDNDDTNLWDDFIPPAEKKPVTISPQKKDIPSFYTSTGKKNKPFLNSYIEGHPAILAESTEEIGQMSASDEHASITLEDIPREANEWRKVFIYNEIFSRKN